jgi:hypothetical protein
VARNETVKKDRLIPYEKKRLEKITFHYYYYYYYYYGLDNRTYISDSDRNVSICHHCVQTSPAARSLSSVPEVLSPQAKWPQHEASG